MKNFQIKLNELKNKIKNREIKIGIIGVGYVGIKLVIEFTNKNFKVLCFDKDIKKLQKIKSGISPFSYIKNSIFKKVSKNIIINNDFKKIPECDVIIICLPTPLKNNKPDLSQIKNTWKKIKNNIREFQIIILESTTYPGTTEEIFLKYLRSKFNIDKNIFLSYSPERENPGDNKFSFSNIPKIVSGIDLNSKKLCEMVYSNIVKKVIPVKNIKVAEMSKLLENIYRSVNIALINELKMLSSKLDINLNDVIDAAKTKPFGFQEFRPGPGVGGHCIPIDPLYLSWIAKKKRFKTKFIDLASTTNVETTRWVINKIKQNLKKKKISKILLLGIAYKKNIEDTRESSGVKIYEHFKKNRCRIDYCDPYVKNQEFRINTKKLVIKSIKNNLSIFKNYDAFILCADHDIFDYEKLIKLNKPIFDLRGRYHKKNVNNKNIISL
jgi:UDP-N-acetyl-D-glucosamine dehydrogenase